jgi:hypothetical protein
VSTIPAAQLRISVEPYATDWSIPQNELAGAVVVIGTYSMRLVVLRIFGKPKDNSPASSMLIAVVGWKKIPKVAAVIDPSLWRLSTTVGTVCVFDTVPTVRS